MLIAFVPLWYQVLLQSNYFMVQKKCLYFIKKNLMLLCFLRVYFIFSWLVFCKFLGPNMHFALQMSSDVYEYCIGPS